MGQLIDGVWQDTGMTQKSTGGRFKRSESAFRNWVTADGSVGPTGKGASPPSAIATISMSRLPVPGAPYAADASVEGAGADDFCISGASANAGKRLDLRHRFSCGDRRRSTSTIFSISFISTPMRSTAAA